ncbi:hypothetical protein ROG8370_02045 [Roseovarius gaetbuli]|uniref:Tetratricopeptide repeat protein n=1 Tax=Roseovarius gaetbuli TaxID=1356575 RepID=A0A1X6ZCI1_9RHOB|nr:tetratricopeptide repeat protein [Roseovarius gaetbuli]SLN47088.1 hypothetical protein ROG8370_02045 [Roseovarius gaetbuli]
MRFRFNNSPLILMPVLMALAACEPSAISEGNNFQRKYSTARKALEAGNYDTAINSYALLIPQSGPLEPRLRLEYAHALLRAGRYDEAGQVSDALASTRKGSDRAAALAVSGAAKHESALAEITAGTAGPQTVAKLRAADAALKEMMALDGDLDPLGAMASRHRDIKVELKQLGARS